MRYDSDGSVQKTLISSTPERDLPKFGLRKGIAKKKLDDFRDKLEQLGALAKSYTEASPEQMQHFISKATVTPELTAQHSRGSIATRRHSMTIWIDAISRKQRRIEIRTSMEGKPVTIRGQFQDVTRDGPTYMAISQVNYDSGSIVINTENFDYMRLQP